MGNYDHRHICLSSDAQFGAGNSFGARISCDWGVWRCWDKADNFLAVMDDFGSLVQIHYLGRSQEW